MADFKETTRLWFGYEDIHNHSSELHKSMKSISPGPSVLVAIGRGGWIPARLVSTFYELSREPVSCLSVIAAYVNLGTSGEHVVLTQGLDKIAIDSLLQKTKAGYNIWVLDGPYLVGRTALFVKNYVSEILKENNIDQKVRIGVLHWVQFDSCPEAPWRKQASLEPDAWGLKIHNDLKPYIEYPWESPNTALFNKNSVQ